MRAALPTESGSVERGGVRVGYEVFGEGDRTIVLMPTWCIVHSRIWKMQVPYLARHFRVVTWDGPGNGAADRPPPEQADAYTAAAHVELALAVLDRTSTTRAVVVAASGGTHRTLQLAAGHRDRVAGVVFVGASTPLSTERDPDVVAALGGGDLDTFLDVFMHGVFTEPHSTKAFEDAVGWGHETTMARLVASRQADQPDDLDEYRALCGRVDCPVLVVHGTEDRVTPLSHGRALRDAIGPNASLLVVEGGGHRTDVRDPVRFSLLMRDFVDRVWPTSTPVAPRTFVRATHRARPRALYLSSPIGLGHARRDVAIAQELRALRPELDIDWLAQDPVTRVLAHEGERVHPASRHLVSEAAHIESESGGHDLHCFGAWRRMDEILVANFMVLHDVLDAEHYDLVIGDEAWEADHFLHENPELKRGAFVWLTDFVGWLPVDGEHDDAVLTADYNAEMIEQVARYPWIRDRSIFVGNPGDIVPDTFGADLPSIRAWTEQHFDFSGYITGFPSATIDRDEVRNELGFGDDELVCVATVGGSSVGTTLLDLVVSAFPVAKAKLPSLRMVVVTGPRIDPRSIMTADGLDVVGFVPDLWRQLAACDLAIVQGGLTTAMELTALQRPFIYFPLRRHFEQQHHVPFRLARYGAGRRMDYATTGREQLAHAILEEANRVVRYNAVERDGAANAAALIADLI